MVHYGFFKNDFCRVFRGNYNFNCIIIKANVKEEYKCNDGSKSDEQQEITEEIISNLRNEWDEKFTFDIT